MKGTPYRPQGPKNSRALPRVLGNKVRDLNTTLFSDLYSDEVHERTCAQMAYWCRQLGYKPEVTHYETEFHEPCGEPALCVDWMWKYEEE